MPPKVTRPRCFPVRVNAPEAWGTGLGRCCVFYSCSPSRTYRGTCLRCVDEPVLLWRAPEVGLSCACAPQPSLRSGPLRPAPPRAREEKEVLSPRGGSLREERRPEYIFTAPRGTEYLGPCDAARTLATNAEGPQRLLASARGLAILCGPAQGQDGRQVTH